MNLYLQYRYIVKGKKGKKIASFNIHVYKFKFICIDILSKIFSPLNFIYILSLL